MIVLDGLDEVSRSAGQHLGHSDWLEMTEARVRLFTAATGDDDPLGHGYLTLSLSNFFLPQIVEVRGVAAGVNYGTGEVRFPSPLKVGQRIRAGAELLAAEPVAGGVQTTIRITIEIEGDQRPACVIDSLSRWLA